MRSSNGEVEREDLIGRIAPAHLGSRLSGGLGHVTVIFAKSRNLRGTGHSGLARENTSSVVDSAGQFVVILQQTQKTTPDTSGYPDRYLRMWTSC